MQTRVVEQLIAYLTDTELGISAAMGLARLTTAATLAGNLTDITIEDESLLAKAPAVSRATA